MTLVVCPNLAVDRVLELPELEPGADLRATCVRQQAGGKGANVVRALRSLGGDGRLVGFAAGRTGLLIAQLADDEGIALEFVALAGEARICMVFLEAEGRRTSVYEYGPPVGPTDEHALVEAVRAQHAAGGEWAVLSGSAPPGASVEFYADLVGALHQAKYKVMLDATDEQLAGALAQRPALVKVNAVEAASVTGVSGMDERAALSSARRLVEAGAGAAVITLGAAGAAVFDDGALLTVSTPPVETVNAVGSGDCFAAALALGLERGLSIQAALPLAAGAGAANAVSLGTADLDADLARRLATEAAVLTRSAE